MIYVFLKVLLVRPKARRIDMIVVRKYKGVCGNSKCCADCIKMMKLVGIRKVYYTTDSGDIICEKIKDIHNNLSGGRNTVVKQL